MSVDRDVEKNHIHVRIESTFNVGSMKRRNGTIVDQGEMDATDETRRLVGVEVPDRKCFGGNRRDGFERRDDGRRREMISR